MNPNPIEKLDSEDPDWRNWWVNPTANNSGQPDPENLRLTQECINRLPEEVSQQIKIHVRNEIED